MGRRRLAFRGPLLLAVLLVHFINLAPYLRRGTVNRNDKTKYQFI